MSKFVHNFRVETPVLSVTPELEVISKTADRSCGKNKPKKCRKWKDKSHTGRTCTATGNFLYIINKQLIQIRDTLESVETRTRIGTGYSQRGDSNGKSMKTCLTSLLRRDLILKYKIAFHIRLARRI